MHGQASHVCAFIDLDEEQRYWLDLFSSHSAVMKIGSFGDCWPLVVLGYSRYLTHIRSGEDVFQDAFLHAAKRSSQLIRDSDAHQLLIVLKARMAWLAEQQQPNRQQALRKQADKRASGRRC
ncbi:hypothetical protein SAMN05428989_1389 [Pseudoxanthomonas sp. GM95]|uniref:hypothetical protein n=1 Tax=Pseudoxanthomonas sp. GM95 TaxID=1881043 RepID=UPI0008B8FBF8|nr:hypothetical protein [Pseudoxanthomonas sp. GM95]SEL08330.1 hypothetical protein SAMN05428989_1389 [Pseudoxanthomonas sp. GM95]